VVQANKGAMQRSIELMQPVLENLAGLD